MNSIERHAVAYIFECLTGYDNESTGTHEILKATQANSDNEFIKAVLSIVKHHDLEEPNVKSAVASVFMDYMKTLEPKCRAVYSKEGDMYIISIWKNDSLDLLDMVISNNLESAVKAIEEIHGKVNLIPA